MARVRTIRRLTGVYDADVDRGTRRILARRLGLARDVPCPLKELTRHPDWDPLVATLGVPFDAVHRDEREPHIAAASDGRTPCVLAHTDQGVVLLLGPADLVHAGNVLRFDQALRAAADSESLVLLP